MHGKEVTQEKGQQQLYDSSTMVFFAFLAASGVPVIFLTFFFGQL